MFLSCFFGRRESEAKVEALVVSGKQNNTLGRCETHSFIRPCNDQYRTFDVVFGINITHGFVLAVLDWKCEWSLSQRAKRKQGSTDLKTFFKWKRNKHLKVWIMLSRTGRLKKADGESWSTLKVRVPGNVFHKLCWFKSLSKVSGSHCIAKWHSKVFRDSGDIILNNSFYGYHFFSSSYEKCWHHSLWFIQSNGDTVSVGYHHS